MAVIEAFSCSEELIPFIGNALMKGAEAAADLSRNAVVFPGKRPGLYLTGYLSEACKSSFFPPRIFTITEFMSYAAGSNDREMDLLDAVYELFTIVQGLDKTVEGHTFNSFEDFVFWGIEIFKLIEELDTELVGDNNLSSVNLPDMHGGMRKLLGQFSTIRKEFHARLGLTHRTTRGLNYYTAADGIKEKTFDEFDHIYFAGLIALTKAEAEVIKTLLNNGRASFFTQVESADDTVTQLQQGLHAGATISGRLKSESPENAGPQKIILHEAPDTHGETESVYGILKEVKDGDPGLSGTAIVLPDAGTLLPLLSNVMDYFPYDYNVTMGYPLKRTPFYTLMNGIFNAQSSRRTEPGGKNKHYYAKDYLRVLKHPYIKGMHDQTVHAVVQQIERYIIDKGKVFLVLEDIEDGLLYKRVADSLANTEEKPAGTDVIRSYIQELHALFFIPFELDRLVVRDFAGSLDKVIKAILRDSSALQYKFSVSFIKGLMDTIEALGHAEFQQEQFDRQRLFALFNSYAEMQTIPFNGIPLKGLQILGLLETRVLNFDRVILLDCNEGVLPSVSRYEPLLPFQVKKALGLPTYREHEYVFRYHFRRLIKGAKEVHLIYKKSEDGERSRFIEEILWDEEKKEKRLFDFNHGSWAAPDGKIGFVKKQFKTEVHEQNKLPIKKDQGILKIIEGIVSNGLSPTAADAYMGCPVRFYYQYILGFKETKELGEEIEARDIGSFVHEVLRIFYTPYVNKTYIHTVSHDAALERLIEDEFEKTFHGEDNGEFFLLKEIIKRLLKEFIQKDGHRSPYLISLEKTLSAPFSSIRGVPVRLKGKIDRIDKKDNEYLIVDYKTGSSAKVPKISKLADWLSNGKAPGKREDMQELIVSFQLPLYLYICSQNKDMIGMADADWEHLNASLFMINDKRRGSKPLFNTKHDSQRRAFMEQVFLPSLKNLIAEMLDPETPFVHEDSNPDTCKYCPFLALCR